MKPKLPLSSRKLHPLRILRVVMSLGFLAILILMLQDSVQEHTDGGTVANDQNYFHHSAYAEKALTTDQDYIDYVASNLDIQYKVIKSKKDYRAKIKFTNNGSIPITTGNWSIYFHHVRSIKGISSRKVPILTLTDVNSYLYKIHPTKEFPTLIMQMSVSVQLIGVGWMVARSDVFPNWYITMDDSISSKPRIIQSTASEDVQFVKPLRVWRREPADRCKPYTAEVRYSKNNIDDLGGAPYLIMPSPVKVRILSRKKTLLIGQDWTIVHDGNLESEAEFLKSKLGCKVQWQNDKKQVENKPKNILLFLDPNITAEGAYEMRINSRNKFITIKGSGTTGVFYGIQSLIQLLPLEKLAPPFPVPAVKIFDQPRFPYRGIMVDVARNFHTKAELFTLMDAMAVYKLNKLHLHLTDDEAWRLEIPGLPELTEIGGKRCHDLGERVCILPMLGSGPYSNTSGSGYYKVADYKELLHYAKARHINVIPEFDMPGHSHAAIQSMKARYHKFMNQGKKEEASHFLLTDLDDNSTYHTVQRFKNSVINPCIESTYKFVEHVISSVLNMHQEVAPLTHFHLGGDEVPGKAYKGSKACEDFMKKNPGIKFLKPYFVKRVADIAAKLKVGLQGWQEAYKNPHDEYISLPNVSVPVSNAWHHIWGSGEEHSVYKQANAGYKVVLTSVSHFYFNNPQEPDPGDWGMSSSVRYVDTKRTFYYRPDSFYDNIDFSFLGERMSKMNICITEDACPRLKESANIIGISGALWTEEVRTPSRMMEMLWPRLLAVAERAWHKADWEELQGTTLVETRTRDWINFANTLGYRELKRLETLGIDYYLPPPGVMFKGGTAMVNTMFPALTIQWSKDQNIWQDFVNNTLINGTNYFRTLSFNKKRYSRVVKFEVPTE